jgi:hypothetical protein
MNGKTTQDTDKQGVFQFILEQPFGKVLLGLVALGLACYTIWRFMQAFMDLEGKGSDAKGVGRRIGYAFSGLIYGFLAFYAAKLALGNGGSGQGDSRQSLVQELLQQPYGQLLVGLVALGTLALGLYQIYRAVSGSYRKKIETSKIKPQFKTMLIRAGKAGYSARGVVWILIAYLFGRAALHANPQEAGGTDKAFQLLEHGTYGSLLLGVVALGLICYGVFMFVRARCEVIRATV